MKPEDRLISRPVLFLVLSLSLLKLAYGSDPLLPWENEDLFCPGFGNCTDGCHFNLAGESNSSTSFKTSDGVLVNCDGMDVNITYPSSTDESFVGKASWICHRYYDANGHHFVVPEITLNKPSDVNDTQIECYSTMDNCTLLSGASPGLKFIIGMPNYCVPGVDDPMPATEPFLPSQTEKITCPGFKNCTGDQCDFNSTNEGSKSQIFYPNVVTQVKCDDLTVDVKYPETKDPEYQGQDNTTCFRYDNGNGTTFQVAEFTFSKPSDVISTQVTCTAEGSTSCTLVNDTSTQLLFVAGMPSGCAPWTPPTPPPTPTPETTTMEPTSTTQNETSTSDMPTTEATTSTGASETTTQPTNTTTPDPTYTTTPALETTTKSGKPPNGEATLVLVLGAALFAGRYM